MDAGEAREIDRREEEIAGLVHHLPGISPVERRPYLLEFLGHLEAGSLGVIPVEADAAQLLLNAMRAQERFQSAGKPGQHALVVREFPGLERLPVLPLAFAEEMRMAALHLRLQPVHHRFPVQGPCLLAQHDLKGHVQKQVAEFPLQFAGVPGANRIHHFPAFLDEVGDERLRGLRPVPGTVRAQELDNGERAVENAFRRGDAVRLRGFGGGRDAIVAGGHDIGQCRSGLDIGVGQSGMAFCALRRAGIRAPAPGARGRCRRE